MHLCKYLFRILLFVQAGFWTSLFDNFIASAVTNIADLISL